MSGNGKPSPGCPNITSPGGEFSQMPSGGNGMPNIAGMEYQPPMIGNNIEGGQIGAPQCDGPQVMNSTPSAGRSANVSKMRSR